MEQKETPWLSQMEKARQFAPEYDTELTEWQTNPLDWQHVCPCRFGPARPSSVGEWSGDSYRYDIYQRDACGGTKYALRCQNGGGVVWLICENRMRREEWSLIEMIAVMPQEARRWDACHFLWQTAHKTALAAAKREFGIMAKAFVEKRLQKRKLRGQKAYRVDVAPEKAMLEAAA